MSAQSILVVGSSGRGKSTICNVTTGTTQFGESAGMASCTGAPTTRTVAIAGGSITVVDTIGIGDTGRTKAAVLRLIADACRLVSGGFHQLIFVTRGRFTPDEVAAFDLIQQLFDGNAPRFTTIVRTDFMDFDNAAACAADIATIRAASPDCNRIFSSCNRVVHVYTPPPTATSASASLRAQARTLLLAHLGTCLTLYRPASLANIDAAVQRILDADGREARELAARQAALAAAQAEAARISAEQARAAADLQAQIAEQNRQREAAENLRRQQEDAAKRQRRENNGTAAATAAGFAVAGPVGGAVGFVASKIFKIRF